jgi:hypothetical protein
MNVSTLSPAHAEGIIRLLLATNPGLGRKLAEELPVEVRQTIGHTPVSRAAQRVSRKKYPTFLIGGVEYACIATIVRDTLKLPVKNDSKECTPVMAYRKHTQGDDPNSPACPSPHPAAGALQDWYRALRASNAGHFRPLSNPPDSG